MSLFTSHRINACKTLLRKKRLDGYIATDERNILYFTDVSGGASLLIPWDDEPILFVPSVNYELTRQTIKTCRVTQVKRGNVVDEEIMEAIKRLKLQRVGFDTLSVFDYLRLVQFLTNVKIEPCEELVRELREVKDESEIRYLRKAAELTSEGVKTALEVINPGIREYEIAAEIEYTMRRLGSDGVAFNTIVASGHRSAFPHGGCTDKKIERGDLVVLDVGANYRHYRADVTRTVMVGKPSPKHKQLYDIVKTAQQHAIDLMKAGIVACEVDAIAREFITKQGYGNSFIHRLGHGVGLDVHEGPMLSPDSHTSLRVGNVLTVEPGIYIVDFGGIRLEDTVLVHQTHAEKLSNVSYTLEASKSI